MKITFDRLVIVLIIAVAGIYIGKYFYKQPQFVNGQKALDFQAQTINKQTFRLSDLKGSYVLLDFWGSWCGPCRMENPEWVALNNRLAGQKLPKANGFHIVSIAVERNEESWKRAIEYDGLNWPLHILDQSSSLKFFNSPIASLYKVRALPSNYLIDPKGMIIGVNVTPEEVEKRIGQ
ncbi:TlpA family protein disulfide reductase [Haliscomenobacter sp.]|uniref:TlpA family protein disulfide reductase n=1 Tax=Haliscomenobacter sp. TaxID=2717303 RepID=UPI0035938C7C